MERVPVHLLFCKVRLDWQSKDFCCLFCSLTSHLLPAETQTAAVHPRYSYSWCCLTIQQAMQKLEVFRAPSCSPPSCVYMTCISRGEDPSIKRAQGLGPC